MMHLHHQEIATFMKNDLKSAVHTGALITSDQSHYIELAQGGIFSRKYTLIMNSLFKIWFSHLHLMQLLVQTLQ